MVIIFENPDLFKKFGKEYGAGEVVFCEYEKGEELYFIVEGKVKISKITKEGEKVVAYIGKGEFIGEMAIFENKPRTATIITEEETKFLIFKKDDFYKLITMAPNIVVELIKSLSKRYISTEKQLNVLLHTDVEKKILNYIYEIAKKKKEKRFEIKIEELLSILNIRKEDIIEKLNSYVKKGYLKISNDTIEVNEIGWIEIKIR